MPFEARASSNKFLGIGLSLFERRNWPAYNNPRHFVRENLKDAITIRPRKAAGCDHDHVAIPFAAGGSRPAAENPRILTASALANRSVQAPPGLGAWMFELT